MRKTRDYQLLRTQKEMRSPRDVLGTIFEPPQRVHHYEITALVTGSPIMRVHRRQQEMPLISPATKFQTFQCFPSSMPIQLLLRGDASDAPWPFTNRQPHSGLSLRRINPIYCTICRPGLIFVHSLSLHQNASSGCLRSLRAIQECLHC